MTLNATASTARGTLRQEVVVDGRHRLVTDQPVAAGGTAAGPSPHELFAAALAACVSVTLAAYARTKPWTVAEACPLGRPNEAAFEFDEVLLGSQATAA